jgi:hypothetical protein
MRGTDWLASQEALCSMESFKYFIFKQSLKGYLNSALTKAHCSSQVLRKISDLVTSVPQTVSFRHFLQLFSCILSKNGQFGSVVQSFCYQWESKGICPWYSSRNVKLLLKIRMRHTPKRRHFLTDRAVYKYTDIFPSLLSAWNLFQCNHIRYIFM